MWTKIKGHIFVETKNKIENYIFEVAKTKNWNEKEKKGVYD